MKLKKSVKVILVLVLFSGMVGGIYFFNSWFFSKYKVENKNVEENENRKDGKEVLNDFENPLPVDDKETTNKEEKNSSTSTKKENEKKRAIEIYYCSKGDTLDGKKCVTQSEIDAVKMELVLKDNKEKDSVVFNIKVLAENYGLEKEDIISVIKEACESEKGTFKLNNSEEASCAANENKIYQYMCLDSSYTLEGTKCVKEVKIPAKVRYGCEDGYKLEGIYCVEE